MNETKISISVIVPIYKIREEYLRQCLNNLINQTLQDIEIILIDDGSPDNAGKICDEYSKVDKRIVVIHRENQGGFIAGNDGMEAAHGTYVMFVDPDDWIELDSCERVFNIVNETKWDLIFFRHDENDESGYQVKSYPSTGSYKLDKDSL